jgi:UDPglucose--hexose-1-phosphate uridylyltransferase
MGAEPRPRPPRSPLAAPTSGVGDLRLDPVSGIRAVIAPGRAHRPGAFVQVAPRVSRQTPDECPFCAGHEDQTPPPTLVLPGAGGDWAVRVVPNLYPALEGPDGANEVVVHTPAHTTAFAGLTLPDVERICEAWASRARAHALAGRRWLLCSINDGPGSGASLDHTHSQLTVTPFVPPLVSARLRRFQAGCPVCAELRARDAGSLTVDEHDGMRVYAPWASALPYQLRAAPLAHGSDALAAPQELASALAAIARVYAQALGSASWNAWLTTRPLTEDEPRLHWHVEAFPRLTVLASLELGAGLPTCTIEPEAAARTLRG